MKLAVHFFKMSEVQVAVNNLDESLYKSLGKPYFALTWSIYNFYMNPDQRSDINVLFEDGWNCACWWFGEQFVERIMNDAEGDTIVFIKSYAEYAIPVLLEEIETDALQFDE